MLTRAEVDYSIEKACGLIDDMMVVEGKRGRVELNVDREKLTLTRDIISGEVTRLEKLFPSSIDVKVRMAEVELRLLQLRPLKLLVSQIDLLISSKDEHKIEAAIQLMGQVRQCRNILSNRIIDDGTGIKPPFKKNDRVITSNDIRSIIRVRN